MSTYAPVKAKVPKHHLQDVLICASHKYFVTGGTGKAALTPPWVQYHFPHDWLESMFFLSWFIWLE